MSALPKGTPRAVVPTPALVLDLDVMERNLETMAHAARQWGVQLRPHAKSHKCVEIARRQGALGALGITCATLDEAEGLIDAKVPGVLLSSPLAGAAKLNRLKALALRDSTITVVLDDPAAPAELAALAQALGIRLRVLIDFDVGQRRTGCRTLEAAVTLARHIQESPHLSFEGVQAYAGHIQHVHHRQERALAAQTVATQVRGLCHTLAQAGLPPRIVTGAGTGSAEHDGSGGVYTELQPGSYLFMDTEYLAVDGLAGRFHPSLWVDTTVVSEQWGYHVTTDAGTKAFAQNGPAPLPATPEHGWTYSYDGDEFGRIALGHGARRPARGERLSFIVPHCDPTVALYSHFVCVRGDVVQDCWPILPRR